VEYFFTGMVFGAMLGVVLGMLVGLRLTAPEEEEE
jgi:hypothetical protein